MSFVRVLLLSAIFTQLFLSSPAAFAQSSETASQMSCFGLSPEDAAAVLLEEVDPIPTLDNAHGYCTFAGVADGGVSPADDLFPTYGPRGEHQYLAVTVWPTGSATDPWMYLAFAILDQDQGRLNAFMSEYGTTDMEALVNAESSREGVSREFLSMLGSGALWYWQATSSGHHLAGIYAVNGEERIAVQALVTPDRTAEEVQAILISKVAALIESSAPASSAPASRPLLRIDPVYVDGCPNFSPYDAAAILQEPVNVDAPVGNLVFGPLSIEYEEMLRGLCGYTNSLAASGESGTQTQLATDLPYGHTVAAGHLTGEIQFFNNGTMDMQWMEMIALAEVVAAANPQNDGKVFDYLYGTFNIDDFASWTAALEILAQGSPSFKVTRIDLPAGDPREELLWLWQTLDDGHFSLLVSRQGVEFDVVAALLGSDVTEKVVLGYSRVLLEKIGEPVTVNAQGNNPCDVLSAEDLSEIVGETVQGTFVQNTEGSGCKYTPATDRVQTQSSDFSPLFQSFGMLAGWLQPQAAQMLLNGFVEELSTTGVVRDGEALGALMSSIQSQNFVTALQQFGELEWNSSAWQVETVGENAILISGKSGNGWTQFHLLQSAESGDLTYLTGVLRNEIDEVREQIVAAAQQAAHFSAETGANPPSVGADKIECSLMSLTEAAAILGDSLRVQRAAGERGEGCKFTPASEGDGETETDFSPDFQSEGILAGIMSDEGAKTTLSELVDETDLKDVRLTRAFSRNDIAGALSRLAVLAPETDDWQVEPLPEVGNSAIWVHGELDGDLLAIFFNGKGKEQTQAIIVQISAEEDLEAMRNAVVAVLMQNQ